MRGVALSGCSLVCAGRAASPFGHQSGGGWDARSAHCLSCVINPTPVALPCFLWGSGSRASGGVCVRAVCSGLGLRSCSATPPPPLADSVSAVSAGEGPRRPAPRVPGDTRRAAQDQPSEERQRHSDTAAAGVTGRCRLRGGGGGDPTPSGGRRTAEASGEGGQRRPPAGRQPALGTAAGTGKMPGSAWNGFAACHLRRGACQRGRHWQEHRHCQMTVEALPACGKEGRIW